jgi:5-methylcytosine-specific restriction endonuclease McrA
LEKIMEQTMIDNEKSMFWIDDEGNSRPVPQIKGRLKHGKCPSHLAVREYVLNRDNRTCRECGATEADGALLVADHILSRRNGGTHHPDNMQCLCDPCNARKAGTIDRNQGKAKATVSLTNGPI